MKHRCCPKEFRGVEDISGSFELDAMIERQRSRNKDIPLRLQMYAERENVYGAKTGYDGYHGYSGDD